MGPKIQCLKTHYFGLLVYTPIMKLAHVTNLCEVNDEKLLLGLGIVKAIEVHVKTALHYQNKYQLIKRGDLYLKPKKYLEFYKLPVTTCNKLFDSLVRPILLHNSEIWGAYEKLNFDNWETDSVERLHTQFYKHYFGLNKRAPNVASRNEAGLLSLKSTIYENILKFWIHLENQPENSIAFQCLQIF